MNESNKTRIAHLAGPTATIQNTPPLVTSNKARSKRGLPLLEDADGGPVRRQWHGATLFGLKFPPKCTMVGSVNWGSIGYSVGALLGALTAAPERRHILFVGDGSFQVSAQELSTILRHDHKPVIFLVNNGGYTIERGYLGKPYLQRHHNWSYADLPKVFRRDAYLSAIVVVDQQGSARSPQRAERHDLCRIHHGPLGRARADYQQQQQGRRARLRASRTATP